MEFLTGVKEKETIGIREILSGDYVGKTVKMNGAVHNIRDMGEFAFIILRKAEGLVQCVYEEGKTEFDLKDLKEEYGSNGKIILNLFKKYGNNIEKKGKNTILEEKNDKINKKGIRNFRGK